MTNRPSEKLRYQSIIEDFMSARGWTDEIEVDPETSHVMLHTKAAVGEDQNGDLFVEAWDEANFIDVYFYYGFTCKESSRQEMYALLNGIHCRNMYGRFMCLPDGRLLWMHRVDFEGSEPSRHSIEQIVSPGWEIAKIWCTPIMAVAFTKQSAEAALEEYDKSARQRQQEDTE